jgi:hypothetical protein
MPGKSKDPVSKINTLIECWRTQERDRTFYGHSLPQYEAAVAEVFAVRTEGADLEKRTRANSARRKDVDAAALALTRNIVHALKADPELGDDSVMYATLGYVRKTDQRPGRRRRRAQAPPPQQGDTKSAEQKT